MPEYKCKNCGRRFFGWGVNEKRICKVCGGRLEAINEIAKYKEINREKK